MLVHDKLSKVDGDGVGGLAGSGHITHPLTLSRYNHPSLAPVTWRELTFGLFVENVRSRCESALRSPSEKRDLCETLHQKTTTRAQHASQSKIKLSKAHNASNTLFRSCYSSVRDDR